MAHEAHEAKHATVKLYWILCAILTFVTAIEWAIFKVPSLRANSTFMIPTLLGMSFFKFVLVCGWYMHLRYDHKVLTKIFAISMLMAIGTYVILVLVL